MSNNPRRGRGENFTIFTEPEANSYYIRLHSSQNLWTHAVHQVSLLGLFLFHYIGLLTLLKTPEKELCQI